MSLWCLQSSFSSIGLTVWKEISFEEFQDGHHGSHLGHQNGTILAILNACVTVISPIKFWLNRTYSLGGDVIWRISRWLPWILERNDFNNSDSLCHCVASHQVLGSIRLTVREEMSFEEFQDGHHGGHLGYHNGTILAILNLFVTAMPPIKFQLNRTYGLGGVVIWRISRWPPSWISEWNDFSNSEFPCCHNASH